MVLASATARAQPNGDQLQAMYDDAMRQLQQAQDRKNQLANENEQLKARLAELQSQLRDAERAADPMFQARVQLDTFALFLEQNADVAQHLSLFERANGGVIVFASELTIVTQADLLGLNWPYRVVELAPIPTTQPTSAPASTEPSTAPSSSAPATAPSATQPESPAAAPTPATTMSTTPGSMPATVPATQSGT